MKFFRRPSKYGTYEDIRPALTYKCDWYHKNKSNSYPPFELNIAFMESQTGFSLWLQQHANNKIVRHKTITKQWHQIFNYSDLYDVALLTEDVTGWTEFTFGRREREN